MLCIISPAKSLFNGVRALSIAGTWPEHIKRADQIVDCIKHLKAKDYASVMGISGSIAARCEKEYQEYVAIDTDVEPTHFIKQNPLSPKLTQAGALFDGPAYKGLDCMNLSDDEMVRCQSYVRFLSGLYGLLSPTDLIQDHRLEMGTKKLSLPEGADSLYAYWADTLEEAINTHLIDGGILVNCASEEYAKAIPFERLRKNITVISCVFLDEGKIKSVYAKKARGLMARYISISLPLKQCIENMHDVTKVTEILKEFDLEGYVYDEKQSGDKKLVFDRKSSLKKLTSSKGVKRKAQEAP